MANKRQRQRVRPPNLTVIRKFLKGKTHRRGVVETRGAKRKWTRANVLKANRARIAKIQKHKGAKYVSWDVIAHAARARKVHRTTVARAFIREGILARFRPSRAKPQRTEEHERERKDICGRMRRWPTSYFTDHIDLIIDNKTFSLPTTPAAREHQQKQQVHGQIRTPSEGIKKGFTKPNPKRHRKFLGGTAHVCAGIAKGRFVLWEYYTKWSGSTAASMYHGPILSVLKKVHGVKRSYLLAEDNDPTGYKSGLGKAAKIAVGIRAIQWPRYSPDLMPLDFTLWASIEAAMAKCAPEGRESANAYKTRLRRVALNLPRAVVIKAVTAMKKRARKIYEADGGDIDCD